jgi:hypothetical protein
MTLHKIPVLVNRLQHVEFMGWHLLLPLNWVWTQVARKRKSHKWWELQYFLLWPQFRLQNFSWRKTTHSPNMYLLVSNIFMSIIKNLESFLCVLNVLILMRTCLKLHVFTECNTLTKLANGLPSINIPFFFQKVSKFFMNGKGPMQGLTSCSCPCSLGLLPSFTRLKPMKPFTWVP